MNILLIDVNCKTGSTGKIVYELYKGINESNNNAAICYGRGELISENNIYRFSPLWEVYLHAFMARITGINGIYSYVATTKLLNIIKEFKPDIVHINDPKAYYMNIGGLVKYLRKEGIKTIWTFHSEYMYTGKCGHSFSCERWKTGCGKCPHIHDYVPSLVFDLSHFMWGKKRRMFDGWNKITIVTPSEWLASRVRESFLSDKTVQVINNGINTDVFMPRDVRELKSKLKINDETVVLSVAPNIMSDLKGGKWVIKIAEKMINERIKFILVGVNKKEINSLPKMSNVIYVERTKDQKELAEYYSVADCFLICSKRENYPTTCLEAQSCGTTVCGFSTGGVNEAVINKVGMFDYGDIYSLINYIKKLPKRDTQSALELHNESIKRWDKKIFISKYIDLYEKTLKRSKSDF